jgi:hypothetical protein
MVKGGKMNKLTPKKNDLYLNQDVFIIRGAFVSDIEKAEITAIKIDKNGIYTYYYDDYNYFLREEIGQNVFLNENDAKKELLRRLKGVLKNELGYVRVLKNKIKKLKEEVI